MSQAPTKYLRATNFTTDALFNPVPSPTLLDAELNRVEVSNHQTIDRLAEIQRDDGALKNGIVTLDSLSPGLQQQIIDAVIAQMSNG